MRTDSAFHSVLASQERAADLPEEQDLYGWLVGSWELDVRHYAGVDVSGRQLVGEVHAGRVLEGRAVQDVWIMPRRSERPSKIEGNMNMYGSTLRLWDPSLSAWRILWSNPARNHYEQQLGRRSGQNIVQLGVRPNGTTTRWMFTEITPSSFHWLGTALDPDGTTWRLEAEFLAKRIE